MRVMIRSLACRADAFLARFDGHVVDHGDYVAIQTPTNPSFYWGNYLLFRRPPVAADVDEWLACFERSFDVGPEEGHRLFAWDCPDGARGEPEAFVPRGFIVDQALTLTGEELHPPPRPNDDLLVRAIEGDAEWGEVRRVLVEAFTDPERAHGEPENEQRLFVERQTARYRRMIEAGMGRQYGAFLDGELVGTLGVFTSSARHSDPEMAGIGRYQLVGTSRAHRNRGVCGTLVHRGGVLAQQELGVRTLVICADAEYHAWRVYASVGLRVTEQLFAVQRATPKR
jgi:hypothetical protein